MSTPSRNRRLSTATNVYDVARWLFVASFTLFATTSSPSIGWHDSSEFVAQAVNLGISHSPGHPLPALLGRLSSLIPVGDLVWRVNLMSSLCAAGAIAFLFLCGQTLLDIAQPSPQTRRSHPLAIVVATMAAVSSPLWSNAVRAEVYALQAMLTAAVIWFVLRYARDAKPANILLASFLASLALANHHLLALVLFFPCVGFVFTRVDHPGWKLSGWAAGIGLIGLSSLAYLPIRSATHPLVNFAAPHTLSRFVWTLKGAAFTKSIATDTGQSAAMDFVGILIALSSALTLPIFLFAVAGTIFGFRNQRICGVSAFLLGIIGLCLTARISLGFDPHTPDHLAYLLPAVFALLLLALSGLNHLCHLASRAKRPLAIATPVAAIATALLIPIQLWSNWSSCNQSNAWASNEIAHWEIDKIPPGSLVLTAYFHTTFRQWALIMVEGARPDITLVDRSFLSYPGMENEAKYLNPDLTELIDSPLLESNAVTIQQLLKIGKHRPVYVQQHPNTSPELAQTITPAGPFAILAPDAERSWQPLDERARAELKVIVDRAATSETRDATGALLWHDATRLQQLCARGDRDAAARVYSDAVSIAPHDTLLKEIAIACQLSL